MSVFRAADLTSGARIPARDTLDMAARKDPCWRPFQALHRHHAVRPRFDASARVAYTRVSRPESMAAATNLYIKFVTQM